MTDENQTPNPDYASGRDELAISGRDLEAALTAAQTDQERSVLHAKAFLGDIDGEQVERLLGNATGYALTSGNPQLVKIARQIKLLLADMVKAAKLDVRRGNGQLETDIP